MPNVDIDIWGAPENAYTGFNQRTGTSNINDPDFNTYPPISLCTYTAVSTYKQLLYQWINGGKLSLNDEIDKSICYVGMYNPDLPQLNIVGLYNNTKNTLSDPLYKTDNTQIQSFFFTGITNYNEFADNLNWGSSQLYTDNYITVDYKLMRYKGGILGTAPNVSPQRNANCNGFLNIFQNFGIRCFILEINVRYKTGTDTYGVTTGIYTLKEYTEQTTEWKSQHPIVSAYCRPFWRANTNGTYSYTKPPGYFCELMPVFTLPYLSNAEGITDNISYHINVCRTTNTRTGYFPIYGSIKQELATSVNSQAVEGSGIAALLVGANRGTLNSTVVAGYKNYWLELDGTDEDNIEFIRRGAAAYGLFFCDDIGDLADSGRDSTRWIDNKMCLGTINEDGLTNGDYTNGARNALQRQFDWSTINDSDYDPSKPPVPPPMPYDNATVFNDIGNISTLTRRYALTSTDVEELGSELWQISSDIINTVQNDEWTKYTADVIDTFLVNDPLSCIVSLEKYPMTIPEESGPVTVKLGKAETNITANITSATTHTYTFTGQLIQPKYGNSFLDYEPYTHMELYVPFCGTVSLDPRDYVGHTLNIRLIVDFTTGTCVAYIMSDNLVIDTVNGTIAVSIPVTGIDSTTLAANITNGIINTRNARYNHIFGTLGKVASPAGILSNVSNLWGSANSILTSEYSAKGAEYELSHQPAPPHTIGSASPVGSWAIDFKARLLIYYPTGDIIDNSKDFLCFNDTVFNLYQSQIGFATVDPVAHLSDKYRGLTVAIAPTLSGMVTDTSGEPATDPELQLIARALEEGVII